VQCAGQDVQLPTDLRHPLALIQQPLRFGQPFGRQPMTMPTRRRLEKGGRPALPIQATAALDGPDRHAKGFDDLALGGGAVDNELRSEQAEAAHVLGAMCENGQVAVEIHHLLVALLKRQLLIDGGGADWKQRQLDLWHGWIVSMASAHGKLEIARRFGFSVVPRPPAAQGAGSGVLRLEDWTTSAWRPHYGGSAVGW
jgi:hypothetical protein